MYRKRNKGWLKHLDFAVLDLMCMQICLALAYFGRHRELSRLYSDSVYQNVVLLLAVFEFVYLFFIDGYRDILKRGYYIELVSAVKEVCLLEMLLAFYLFAVKSGDDFSRTVLFLLGIYELIGGYLVRILWKKHVMRRQSKEGENSLLLVTTSEYLEQVLENVRSNNFQTYFPAGIVLIGREKGVSDTYEGIPLIPESEMTEWVCRNWVDEALIVLPQEQHFGKEYMEAFSEMGIVTHYSIMQDFADADNHQIAEKVCGYLVLTSGMQLVSNRQYLTKRVMDIAGGIAGSLITVILTIILGPLIYIKSPGPIFFTQKRVGKNGKLFKMYKFRTMCPDAEQKLKDLMERNEKDGPVFKMKNDPRITRVGKFLRKTSIDELPQLFNVLKGEMSIVGPRPALPREVAQYTAYEWQRLYVTPGLSCYWQIAPHRDQLSFEEWMDLDIKYVHERSFPVDWKIIFRTFRSILFGHGE